MDHPVKITLVANAGVLMEYRGKKLLLDGIFHAESHEENPFSNIPAPLWNEMREGRPPFDGIDCLLFTHNHVDHFSPELTREYLVKQPVKAVFLPTDEGEQGGLRRLLQEKGIPFLSLDTVANGRPVPLESGITVTAFHTRHVDKAFLTTPHDCYLLSFDGKKLLFTADVDYTFETFPELKDVPLRAVFVNPLFFGALQSRRFFRGELQTRTICIYHVPFPEDDIMHYRTILTQGIARWGTDREELLLLDQAGQQVVL